MQKTKDIVSSATEWRNIGRKTIHNISGAGAEI